MKTFYQFCMVIVLGAVAIDIDTHRRHFQTATTKTNTNLALMVTALQTLTVNQTIGHGHQRRIADALEGLHPVAGTADTKQVATH